MTTRRERLTTKLAKREEWAEKADTRSNEAYARSSAIADRIPFGQPILVGHHSEKSARRDYDRIHKAMDKSVAEMNLAKHHRNVAESIAHALKKSIYSDDDNAIEALEKRIAKREQAREDMKKVNALYRKGDAAGLEALGLNLDTLRAKLADAYSWCQQPYPSFELTNLGAKIRSDKERLEQVKRLQSQTEKAQQNGGVFISRGDTWCSIRFAEKPARDILDPLRSAHFIWRGGQWHGPIADLPQCIIDLEHA